jgi:phosphoribosylaminoimidazolecarboxamide formyltransferase/IMP cyclohydrolase
MIKRALLSVWDKTGIEALARGLAELGVTLTATSGTTRVLRDHGIAATEASELTAFPEMLDGRIKTLHPAIHGAIMAVRSNESHMSQLQEKHIEPIDMVVSNLYPFKETIRKGNVDLTEAMEHIDTGGPALIRSSALNYRDVLILVDPSDYGPILEELQRTGSVSLMTRYKLAYKAFMHTSHYDTLIQNYFRSKLGHNAFPDIMTLTYEKVQDMRYGENPHQKAALYREVGPAVGCISEARQIHGIELSYNNIDDANEAIALLKEFDGPSVVVVKNGSPYAAASGSTIEEAWHKALNADPAAIFGGIAAANREIDVKTAQSMAQVFLEVLVAPSFSEEAAAILKEKKNLRLLCLDNISKKMPEGSLDLKKVIGGLLVQSYNDLFLEEPRVVTQKQPDAKEWEDLRFALKVAKHASSDAIVLARDEMVVGIGQGQSSRISAIRIAAEGKKAKGDLRCVLASDGFLTFPDTLEEAAKAGVSAIIQPGGSQRDQEIIAICDRYGIAMVFSGIRHLRH